MASKLITNLPHLQNFIKRDPESYREEFESQFVYYVDALEIFKLSPSNKDFKFYELVMFLAQVAQCYPDDEEVLEFPNEIVSLLRTQGPVLHPETRMGLLKALILLRNKNLLPPMLLIDVCFDLLRCQDKSLRKLLQLHIITDIKNINSKSKNMVLNRELQDFLSKKLLDNHAVAVKTALDVMIELYRKGVWRDKRNVNIIASACYSKVAKIMVTAIKFFVGNDEGEMEDSSDSEEEEHVNVKKAMLAIRVKKNSKKKERLNMEKVKKAAIDNNKKKNQKLSFDFSALHLIHDPQTIAEKIFKIFNKRNERFEVKLLMMNMVSRLIGIHQLYLSNFYPTLQRYLFPHQREVTKVMTYAAQAAHALVPPDDLHPVLRSLADNFVTERYSCEVMSMGLNAIRELCNRNIHAMDEDLLQDLVGYRNHRDKGVYMASRSLMTLFRQKNPELLERKTRGVPTELLKEGEVLQFGENTAKNFIPGAEILVFKTKAEDFMKDDGFGSDSNCSEDEEMEEGEENGDKDTVLDEPVEVNSTITSQEDEESESEEYDSDCDGDGENDDGETDDDNEKENTDNDEQKAQEQPVPSKTNKELKKFINEDKSSEPPKIMKKKEAISEVMKMTPTERATVASDIMSSRFLTDEDFARIDAVQAAKQVERFKNKKSSKRKREAELGEDRDVVPLSSIEMIYKKRRHDKAARMKTTLEVRQSRQKYGSTKGRMNPHASTTNREKSKAKIFDMMKHKMRSSKQKSTFQEKQSRLKLSMLRQLKNSY
uniref:Protein SDA1 n=1 Tax=Hirondellea gigas TaxID=1518452 RepID=A0A2P2I0T7_9CRUS